MKKPKISAHRKTLRLKYWEPLRERLRAYLDKQQAGAYRLAVYLQCAPSQIHRYTCPVCEHDAEPKFSTAMEILSFLDKYDKGEIDMDSLRYLNWKQCREQEKVTKAKKQKAEFKKAQAAEQQKAIFERVLDKWMPPKPYSVLEAQIRKRRLNQSAS